MLVFIIPLKSTHVSNNWERVSQLLERCLKSITNQTSPNFQVLVVGHEKPLIQSSYPNVHYLTVHFPIPQHLPGESEQVFLNRKRTDKGRKILKGLMDAGNFNPSHTMLVDADDLVSSRLVEFVDRHPQHYGWFIDKGYRYEEDQPYIYYKRKNFYRMCGSCNIVRYDLNWLPETPQYNRGYGYYKQYIDHEKVKGWLEKGGTPLQPLPFAGAVYVVANGENQYYEKERFYGGIANFFNNRRVTQKIRDEFNLYPIRDYSQQLRNLQLTLKN